MIGKTLCWVYRDDIIEPSFSFYVLQPPHPKLGFPTTRLSRQPVIKECSMCTSRDGTTQGVVGGHDLPQNFQ